MPVAPSSNRGVRRAANVSPPEIDALRSSADFRRVLKEGDRYRSRGLTIVRSLGRPGPPRFGLVVPKSAGNAVTRNRIKRRLRHAVTTLNLEPGNDYVIIASEQVAEVSSAGLVSWLREILDRSDRA